MTNLNSDTLGSKKGVLEALLGAVLIVSVPVLLAASLLALVFTQFLIAGGCVAGMIGAGVFLKRIVQKREVKEDLAFGALPLQAASHAHRGGRCGANFRAAEQPHYLNRSHSRSNGPSLQRGGGHCVYPLPFHTLYLLQC
ncbi:MAG: hypothetical protein JWL75_582 [Parcubacteria group bacterium]|nr:hypothetical protein [Parcubacteria group bacterium]